MCLYSITSGSVEGQGRPTISSLDQETELDVSQLVRPIVAEPEIHSLSMDRKGMKKHLKSDQIPVWKEVAGDMRSDVETGGAIETERIEVANREGEDLRYRHNPAGALCGAAETSCG